MRMSRQPTPEREGLNPAEAYLGGWKVKVPVGGNRFDVQPQLTFLGRTPEGGRPGNQKPVFCEQNVLTLTASFSVRSMRPRLFPRAYVWPAARRRLVRCQTELKCLAQALATGSSWSPCYPSTAIRP